jgi:hypothetical protein
VEDLVVAFDLRAVVAVAGPFPRGRQQLPAHAQAQLEQHPLHLVDAKFACGHSVFHESNHVLKRRLRLAQRFPLRDHKETTSVGGS